MVRNVVGEQSEHRRQRCRGRIELKCDVLLNTTMELRQLSTKMAKTTQRANRAKRRREERSLGASSYLAVPVTSYSVAVKRARCAICCQVVPDSASYSESSLRRGVDGIVCSNVTVELEPAQTKPSTQTIKVEKCQYP